MTAPSLAKAIAKAQGKTRYFTGIACKRGHIAERSVSGNSCIECGKMHAQKHSRTPQAIAYRKKWYQTPKAIAYRRKWRAQPHVREKDRAYAAKYAKSYHYGLSWQQYSELLIGVGNKCEICRREFSPNVNFRAGRRSDAACIDHCHGTGKIRGVLCNRCNRALGLLQEKPEILRAAIEYLARHYGDQQTP